MSVPLENETEKALQIKMVLFVLRLISECEAVSAINLVLDVFYLISECKAVRSKSEFHMCHLYIFFQSPSLPEENKNVLMLMELIFCAKTC